LNQLKSFDQIKLKNLQAYVEGEDLIFKTDSEEARVSFQDGKIIKVEHSSLDKMIMIEQPIKKLNIGERSFVREVDHFLIKGANNNLMRLGQTFHVGEGGTWSSLPHDFENYPESDFEEVFFYLLSGGSERAIQVGKGKLFDGSEINDAWIVEDRMISQIPMGYHPVVGEPDVRVSYIWCYLCIKEEWEKI